MKNIATQCRKISLYRSQLGREALLANCVAFSFRSEMIENHISQYDPPPYREIEFIKCGYCFKNYIPSDQKSCSECEIAEKELDQVCAERKTSKFIVSMFFVALLIAGCGEAFAQVNVEKLADAIYLAEGGPKAKKPYGILSVKCNGEHECRRICINTIKNNIKRWELSGKSTDYLSFLAKKYAPVGAKNDPLGFNKNWLKNVKYFYAKAVR